MNYTPAQQEAIQARGSNLLVSAAAGSGKTAVLAARIVSLAKEGVPLDRMLVMTFTRAAAAEMRARILESLYQEGLREQALRVERADITTLHGFCGQICRTYFEAAGVDPMYRVGDGAETALLKEAALADALEALYAEPTPGFAYAALCLSRAQLENAADDLYAFLLSRPDPWEWLESAMQQYDIDADALPGSCWAKALCEQAASELQNAFAAAKREAEFCARHAVYEQTAGKDFELVKALCEQAESDPFSLQTLGAPTFPRKQVKPKDMDDDIEFAFGELRTEVKTAVKRAFECLEPLRSPETAVQRLRESKLIFSGIVDAVRRFHAEFAEKKAARSVLDFSDLESRALQALSDETVQRDVREKYRYVFIDEYQDSSLLQEALLSRVRGERNLFLVGDVKQSIYRFRLAAPELFLEKLRTFETAPGAENRQLSLNANFRSDPAVLYAVNDVFRRVFSGGAMELEYPEHEQLAVGVAERPVGVKPEMMLLCSDAEPDEADDDDLSPVERAKTRQEAELIARRIEQLMAEDPTLRLRDIAILMRSVRGRAAQMIDVLNAHGFAAVTDMGEDLLAQPEVLAVLAVLHVMDNAKQDIPLLAALRGPALGLDDAALARIREMTPEGTFELAVQAYMKQRSDPLSESLRDFYARLSRWTEDARVLPLERLIYRIYDKTGIYAKTGTGEDGAQRQNRLRMLAELAGKFEKERACGLSGFLRMVERIAQREGVESRALADDENVIRLTTIHKSKGLQYPVVFVAGAGNRFMGGRRKSVLSMHDKLGAAAPAIDPYLRAKCDTVFTKAVAAKQKAESTAEEARILYVALTRAEKRLFIVGTACSADAERWMEYGCAPVSAVCMLDWVAPVAFASETWNVQTSGFVSLEMQEKRARGENPLFPLISMHEPVPEEIREAMMWRQAPAIPHPLKQGVTARVRVDLRGGEHDETPKLRDAPRRPAFLEETGLTGAERGNAVHAFFQHVPLACRNAAAAVPEMVAANVLSPAAAQTLPLAALDALLNSPLFERIRAADTVRREWAFTYCVDEAPRVLLQGVIDCCFVEDGAWVLLDYKTEAHEVDAETLRQYAMQLNYYRRALEEVTAMPVKERLLCFVTQRKIIDVSRETFVLGEE